MVDGRWWEVGCEVLDLCVELKGDRGLVKWVRIVV